MVTKDEIVFTAPGEVSIRPIPDERQQAAPDQVLVRSLVSLISAGTELSRLHNRYPGEYPYLPGYSNVGEVVAVGDAVEQFAVGDIVSSLGPHAGVFAIDAVDWLVQKVPDRISPEHATFATLGRVALHGIRLAQLSLGEPVVVVGLGLVGQLSLRLARLSGANPVIGVDTDHARLEIAKQNGASVVDARTANFAKRIAETADHRDVCRALYTTNSSDAMTPTFEILACRGRIVVVGGIDRPVTLDLRTEFQMKELEIIGCHQPKCPKDATPYYRWSQAENHRCIVDSLANQSLSVDNLISHRLNYTEAARAYQLLEEKQENALGILLAWD